MRAKVLKQFIDKNNRGLVYKIGTEIEVTKKRFDEINATQHGVLIEEIKEEKKETKKKK